MTEPKNNYDAKSGGNTDRNYQTDRDRKHRMEVLEENNSESLLDQLRRESSGRSVAYKTPQRN